MVQGKMGIEVGATSVVVGADVPPTTALNATEEGRGWPAIHGDEGAWRDVGSLHDIPQRGARVVTTTHGDIAIFRTGDDRVFALHDSCPHKAGRLSQGIVHGAFVTCPLHNWVISLSDGRAREPDEGCARSVPVRLGGTRILLALNA